MLVLKDVLLFCGIAMIASAAGILVYDLRREWQQRLQNAAGTAGNVPPVAAVRWRTSLALALLAWGPILLAFGIVVVPSGMAGVLVSQANGTLTGPLYPGAHLVIPFAENIRLFDTRDQLFMTGATEDGSSGPAKKFEPLNVQAKEGLTLGLAISVRYRLDPKRLDYIQANLPLPVEKEIVPAVVASAWRELVPNYTVRDVFATKREEVRKKAADVITRNLATDGIIVKEVMLRDIQLPPEYAKGLENLLLKEQENDQMAATTEIQAKQVRISELEAEAVKAQQVEAGGRTSSGAGVASQSRS